MATNQQADHQASSQPKSYVFLYRVLPGSSPGDASTCVQSLPTSARPVASARTSPAFGTSCGYGLGTTPRRRSEAWPPIYSTYGRFDPRQDDAMVRASATSSVTRDPASKARGIKRSLRTSILTRAVGDLPLNFGPIGPSQGAYEKVTSQNYRCQHRWAHGNGQILMTGACRRFKSCSAW
jgi:hypothetical protein